jgi:hypothetical protein
VRRVPASWYGVLVNALGTIVSTYTSGGWSTTVSISGGGYSLEVVSYAQLDGAGYSLSAYSAGSLAVSGDVVL